MADRLTQLQDAVNVQAENLCNSIGLLQQCSRPTPFPDFDTFTRSSSLAYKQVLIDAGIPVDLDDIDLLKQQNDDLKNGHENNVNNENNNANIVNNTNVNKKSIDNNKMNSDNVKQQQNSDTNINGDDQQHQQQLQQQTFFEPGENSRLFAKLITKTAKDIDLIINSLPSREMESELQEAHIKVLELENSEETKKLENVIDKAEKLLDIIKNALEDIAQNQMRMKQLESQMLTSSSSPTTITTPQQKSSSLSLTSNDIEDKKTLSTKILHNLLEPDDHDDFNNDLPD